MRNEYPGTKLLAPGSVGEANADWAVATGGYGNMEVLPSADLAASTGDADASSYHHYGATSQRCAAMGHQTSAEQALSEEWLDRTDQTLAYYLGVRDKFMPGNPLWNTETADAACGGNRWASTFLDTFRYLDQLGRLARKEVEVVIHNTLVASDYGLLDEDSFEPKPNFWGALLCAASWGQQFSTLGFANRAGMHVYAHCLCGVPGGVAVLVLNTDRHKAGSLNVPAAADRYTLTAASLTDKTISLNGTPMQLGPNDALPPMAVRATTAGEFAFAPGSVTFLAIPFARNGACQ